MKYTKILFAIKSMQKKTANSSKKRVHTTIIWIKTVRKKTGTEVPSDISINKYGKKKKSAQKKTNKNETKKMK